MSHDTMTAYPMPDHANQYLLMQAMMGKKLRLLRRRAKLSLQLLWARTGVPSQLIQAYEMGYTPIPLHTFWILCHGLGVSPAEMFRSEPPIDVGEFLPAACREFY
ncbi:MAG: helix-turn-helix transcriptional regulator [Planctomycetota bacterium]